LPTSTGESPYYLEIEKGYNKYMEEYHSTPSSHTLLHMAAGLLPMAAAPLSLFFSSLHVLTHSHIYIYIALLSSTYFFLIFFACLCGTPK
jgi:hypothetical protein